MMGASRVRTPLNWRRIAVVGGSVIGAAIVVVSGYLAVQHLRYYNVTAYFTSTTGLYVGDDVRVVGVDVGRVTAIAPQGDRMRVELKLAREVPVAEDAKAVIVAQSLVSARFVQLTPAVTDGADALNDGAEIPLDRTAVPVEWDQIKEQLGRAADALGPDGDDRGPAADFLDGAGSALAGNGEALGRSVTELSEAMSTLDEGGADLFGTIRGLQTFTTALAASDEQIVQFQGRLANVSSVLAESRTQLAPALADLDAAVVDVQRFVEQNRTGLTEQIAKLADVSQVLVDKRAGLEKVLHLAPTALSNYYNVLPAGPRSDGGCARIPERRQPDRLDLRRNRRPGQRHLEEGRGFVHRIPRPVAQHDQGELPGSEPQSDPGTRRVTGSVDVQRA